MQEQRESLKSNKLHNYLIIETLPSEFRSYQEKKIFVRGLFFNEMLAISKLTSFSLDQLLLIFDDVIQGIPLKDLEPLDFFTLITISSLHTVKDIGGWNYKGICDNCDEVVKKVVNLFDLTFEPNKIKTLPIPLPMKDGSIEYLSVLTVRDRLEKEKLKQLCNDDEILDLALMLKTPEKTIEEKIDFIKTLEFNDLLFFTGIKSELMLSFPSFELTCPHCTFPNKKYLTMESSNVLPSVGLETLYKVKYLWTKSFNCNIDTEEFYKDVLTLLELNIAEKEKLNT